MGRPRINLFVLLLLLGGAVWLTAATLSAQTHIVYVQAPRLDPTDGSALYEVYCASCHGIAGRGNGPAAPLLNRPVPNISTLAVREGTFSAPHVIAHVNGGYGRECMPEWKDILHNTYKSGNEQLALRNIVVYVETMQVKQ